MVRLSVGVAVLLLALSRRPGARRGRGATTRTKRPPRPTTRSHSRAGGRLHRREREGGSVRQAQARHRRERLFQQTNRHELMRPGRLLRLGSLRRHLRLRRRLRVSHDRGPRGRGHRGVHRSCVVGRPSWSGCSRCCRTSRRRELMFDADLVWVAGARARCASAARSITSTSILAAGGGVIDSVAVERPAGNGGFGLKFFLGRAFAMRIDVRDYIFRQQLLSQKVCRQRPHRHAGGEPLLAD